MCGRIIFSLSKTCHHETTKAEWGLLLYEDDFTCEYTERVKWYTTDTQRESTGVTCAVITWEVHAPTVINLCKRQFCSYKFGRTFGRSFSVCSSVWLTRWVDLLSKVCEQTRNNYVDIWNFGRKGKKYCRHGFALFSFKLPFFSFLTFLFPCFFAHPSCMSRHLPFCFIF